MKCFEYGTGLVGLFSMKRRECFILPEFTWQGICVNGQGVELFGRGVVGYIIEPVLELV